MGFSLPQALKDLRDESRWCAWNLAVDRNKPDRLIKLPINPHTGGGAMVNEPSTWGIFSKALNMAENNARKQGLTVGGNHGVGILLGGGYAGIDIDGAILNNGEIKSFAIEIIERMNSYTEFSPSGRGFHILCRVDDGFSLDGLQGVNNRERGLEIYCGGHYFTVTGNVYGEEKPLENRSKEILEIYREYFVKPREERAKKQPVNVSAGQNSRQLTGYESDHDLLIRMFDSQHGRKIQALWNGDISGYESPSQADLALCNFLAYWTGHDARQIDSMFRQSRLMRPKWDEKHDSAGQTYGQITITRAMRDTPEYNPPATYSPNKKQESSGAVLRPMSDFFNPERDSILGNDDSTPQAPVNAGSADNEPHTVLTYLEKSLQGDLKRVMTYRKRKTGYSNIDRYNSLFPGLYVIGSVTGNGKTTFCGQMADYLARSGEAVLFFSLEQTELELVTKGLARLTAQENSSNAVSAIDIRKGKITDSVIRAIGTYKEFAGNLRIIECGFNVDVDGIINTVKNFMAIHEGVKPVVFVDYLQIVKPAKEAAKMTKRDSIDDIVQRFKKLSAENDLAIILISSMNRQNYLSVVDLEAFKESGGIEYTADVVWGLQLLAMNAGIFEQEKSLQKKRKFVREQKNASPRKMELIGLKNRYGRSGTRYFFDYYAEYDLFVPFERDEEEIDAEMTQAFNISEAQNESGSDSKGKGTKKIKDSK